MIAIEPAIIAALHDAPQGAFSFSTGLCVQSRTAVPEQRRVAASTTHFVGFPYLLEGDEAVATIPMHAAHATADMTGLLLLRCPLPPRDAALANVQSARAKCFDPAQVRLA